MTNLILNGNFKDACLEPWVSYSPGEIIFALEHGRVNIYLNEGRSIQQPVKKLPRQATLCFYARSGFSDSKVQLSFVASFYGFLPDKTLWCSPVEIQPFAEWQRFTHQADVPDGLRECFVSIHVNKAEVAFDSHERRQRKATGSAVQFRDFQLA